jgi:hypothetical protein
MGVSRHGTYEKAPPDQGTDLAATGKDLAATGENASALTPTHRAPPLIPVGPPPRDSMLRWPDQRFVVARVADALSAPARRRFVCHAFFARLR